jgi:hypothetical protein
MRPLTLTRPVFEHITFSYEQTACYVEQWCTFSSTTVLEVPLKPAECVTTTRTAVAVLSLSLLETLDLDESHGVATWCCLKLQHGIVARPTLPSCDDFSGLHACQSLTKTS